MKKKIVNVILSVAVVTSMMFAVTACGSKDNGNATSGSDRQTVATDNNTESKADDTESSVVDDTESSVVDDTESSVEDDAKSSSEGMTAEEWVNTKTAESELAILNEAFEGQATISFEGEGNVLSIVFKISDEVTGGVEGASLTDEQMTAMQEAMQQAFEGQEASLKAAGDGIREEIGNDDIAVRIIYEFNDGTEIFSQDL